MRGEAAGGRGCWYRVYSGSQASRPKFANRDHTQSIWRKYVFICKQYATIFKEYYMQIICCIYAENMLKEYAEYANDMLSIWN